MSKILKQVAAALLLLATDPCLGQPLAPAAKIGLGGAGVGAAAFVLGSNKETGTVVSTATTLVSILESVPAGRESSGIIGPLAAGPAASISVASGSKSNMPGTSASAFEMLLNGGFVLVTITTSTSAVSTTGTQ